MSLALISFSVCVISIGQTAMKYAAQKIVTVSEQSVAGFIQANAFPILIIAAAMLLYLFSTVAWVIALRTTPLSVAYMFNAVAFVLVPALSLVIFSESLPKYYIPSLALISVAIYLLSKG